MDLLIHTDGGARENPGPAGAGIVIRNAATGATLHEAGYYLGTATNNEAEYTALIRALEVAKELGGASLHLNSDSQLIVEQVNGRWKVKEARLQPLCSRAQSLLRGFPRAELKWVRRDKNADADRLYNLAMDARADVIFVANGKPTGVTPPAPSKPGAERLPGGEGSGSSAGGSDTSGGLPCFTATLAGKARQCLAGSAPGNEYTLGPTTPDGLCIHAAAAALNDGPLAWPASRRTGQTRCRACGQPIQLTRLA